MFIIYRIAGRFGKFGQLSVICQTKTTQISNKLMADLFIRQTFFAKIFIHPLSPNIIAIKVSRYMV